MATRLYFGTYVSGLLLSLLPYTADAGNAINRFLLQAHSEPVSSVGPVVPEQGNWLSDAEFRYDMNENGDYSLALRFIPDTADRGNAEYSVQQLLITRDLYRVREEQARGLLQRYLQLLEVLAIQISLESLQAESNLDADRVQYYRSQVHTETFQIADLQNSELAKDQTDQQIELTRLRLQTLLKAFDYDLVKQLNVLLENWETQVINWDTMIREMENNRSLDPGFEFHENVDAIDLKLAREKLKIEREERDRWFEFLEVKLRELDSGDQETSIALSIPLGTRPLEMVQRSLAVNRADFQFKTNLYRRQVTLRTKQRELKWNYQQVLSIQQRLSRLQQQLNKLQAANQIELVLTLKSELLKLQDQLQQLRIRGVGNFLALLQENGQLVRRPLSNWMLQDRPQL